MIRTQLAGSAATLVLALAASAAPVPKEKPKLYYPTRVGAKWVYATAGPRPSEYTEVVTAVESKAGKELVAVGREVKGKVTPLATLEVSPQGLYRVKTGTTTMDPPRCLLKLPARAGDSWTHAPPPGQGLKASYVYRGEEEVVVPAGKFTAVRVESELVQANGTTSQVTYWYAPGVGRVKQLTKSGTMERVEELKSFRPGED